MVISSPPENGEERESTSPYYINELFKKCLPFYLSIGMTPDQFYKDDYELTVAYRESYERKRKRENEAQYMQGLYFYYAVCAVSPVLHAFAKAGTKPLDYLDEPLPLTLKDAELLEERRMKRKQEEIKAKIIAKMEEEKKRKGGE